MSRKPTATSAEAMKDQPGQAFARECFPRIKVDSHSWRILAALRLPQIARSIFDPEASMWLIPDQQPTMYCNTTTTKPDYIFGPRHQPPSSSFLPMQEIDRLWNHS